MSNSQLQTYKSPGELQKYLEKGKGSIAMALPKHLNPDRMLRLALTAFSTTPALRQCTGQSILASIVVASQLGLEPGVAGQGYLIPYKNTCTFVPGWQGLVGLLNNTGRATAWTGAVYEGDVWDFQLGSKPTCVHIPGDNYGDASKMTWVYACGKVNGSEQPVIEAWPISRVWRHRDKFNKVGDRHYSHQHPEMYARKVVLLQVLKYMPRSIELNNALVATEAAEMNRTTIVQDGTVIDIDPESGLPEGNVGSTAPSMTETVAQQTRRMPTRPAANTAAVTEPAGEAKGDSAAPDPAVLLKSLMEKGAVINVGASKIKKTLVAENFMKEDEKLEALDANRLANILDAWEDISHKILNPE